jgi:arabinofuranosyltransferase
LFLQKQRDAASASRTASGGAVPKVSRMKRGEDGTTAVAPPSHPVYLGINHTTFTLRRTIGALATLAFAVVLFRTAWISDDAAITLRTVLNVTHGFGLTFNIAERVQTYTHPLWMGLLTLGYLAVGNVYATTFAAGILCSLAAFWFAVSRAGSPLQALTAAITLLFSEAFVDFSTSGLENPLFNLLIVGFVAVFLRNDGKPERRLTMLWGLAALLYLTRPDAVLVVGPLLALATWQARQPLTILRSILIGAVPAIAWTLFAIVYYGFPFPNTAYAKLAMGIDPGELRVQGILYLLDSLDRDPLTLSAIATASAIAVFQRNRTAQALAAGIVLYLVYVVSIGGDFMAGRFLAAPVFASVVLMARLLTGPNRLWGSTAVALLIVGTTSSHLPLWSNSRYGDAAPKPSGIVDERAVYFRDRSLVLAKRGTFRDPDWPTAHAITGRRSVVNTCGLMGAAGIDFGPYIHLLDECALADPLLARLPAVFNPEWRTGHYRRMIPAGYVESLENSTNQIQDPELRQYYDQLRLITRGRPLFSAERLRAIVSMNARKNNRFVNAYFYRHNGSVARLEQLATVRPDGLAADADGNHGLASPLAVAVPARRHRRYLDVTLDSDDRYNLIFLQGSRIVSTLEIGPVPPHRRHPGLADYTLDIPPRARAAAFDTIVVSPAAGDSHYALGHLLVEGNPSTDWELYRRVAVRDSLIAARQ